MAKKSNGIGGALKPETLGDLLVLCKTVFFLSNPTPFADATIEAVCNCGCNRVVTCSGNRRNLETGARGLVDFLVAHGAVKGKRRGLLFCKATPVAFN